MTPRPFNISSIAIIGAGPCGLASAKYLLAQRAFDSIAIFEQQPESALGGVWYYTSEAPAPPPAPQTDPFHPPDEPLRRESSGGEGEGEAPPVFMSPMYDELHANIPGTLMNFKNLPFPPEARVFPSREVIREYVVRYAQDVKHLISFSTEVTDARPRTSEGGREKWDLTTRSTVDGAEQKHTFDAVVVANGHYSVPFIPEVENLSAFQALHGDMILHSKQFRTPRAFAGKRVLVVGNGPSGLDIAYQIRPHAESLLLSVREPTQPEKLSHISCPEVPEVIYFRTESRTVVLKDGTELSDLDAVIFCTGFLFSYPFLPTLNTTLMTKGKGVHGLYEHLFFIDHPTLVFPGLLMRAVPFPVAEAQAAAFSAVWANVLDLPPTEEMRKASRELDHLRGDAIHVLPKMADGEYINAMHDWVLKARARGKEPPYWGPRQMWERKIFAEAKIRFEDDGCRASTLEDLGFRYDSEAEGRVGATEMEP